MNRHCPTRALGTVAGALLGAAILPLAVALADDNDFNPAFYTFQPVAPETLIGIYNSFTAPPGADGSIQGYQPFDVTNTNGDVVGTFYAYESTFPYLAPDQPASDGDSISNQELLVTSDVPGSEDTTGTIPPNGSVFSNIWFFGHTFENVYSSVPGSDGDASHDTLVTPLGNVDLTWLIVDLLGFNAADPPAVLPDEIQAHGSPMFTAISGLAPLDITPQGYQQFDFLYNGSPVGMFDAATTPTTDVFGFHTEALLVTNDVTGIPGTKAGDIPPVGSVFNTIELKSLPGVQLDYSSLPSPSGNAITTTLVTPLGKLNLSPLFQDDNASAGLTDGLAIQPFSFGEDTIAPDRHSPEVFTGINGLAPQTTVIQGQQLFDVSGADGTPVGSFDADVASMPNLLLTHYSLALVVTSDSSGTPGDDPGDVPPPGSLFDIVNYGLGFQNMYYDLPGIGPDGANLIKDFFTIPGLGPIDISWLAQGTNAAAGLTDVAYSGSAWTDLYSLP